MIAFPTQQALIQQPTPIMVTVNRKGRMTVHTEVADWAIAPFIHWIDAQFGELDRVLMLTQLGREMADLILLQYPTAKRERMTIEMLRAMNVRFTRCHTTECIQFHMHHLTIKEENLRIMLETALHQVDPTATVFGRFNENAETGHIHIHWNAKKKTTHL